MLFRHSFMSSAYFIEVRVFRKFLTGKPNEKRSRGRFVHKWKGKITIDLKEIVFNAWTWFDSTQVRNFC